MDTSGQQVLEVTEPVDRLRNLLIEAARGGRTMTYAQAASAIGLDVRRAADSNELQRLLRVISEREHKDGRPLLSAVCVMAGIKRPGQGFFDLARQLGVMPAGEDNRAFFEGELQKVYVYWRTTG